MTPAAALRTLATTVRGESATFAAIAAPAHLKRLRDAAEHIGRSWCGSWIGYHANIYYKDFVQPPPGAQFSSEWGPVSDVDETRGDWFQYAPDGVEKAI